jgi:hypothetical protein
LLMGIGFAVASRSWLIGIALAMMFFAIYIPVIHGEEEFLRKKFPEFDTYARQVPRIFLRISPYQQEPKSSGEFSSNLYLKHREYNALLGTLAIFVVLAAKIMLSKG